MARNSADIVLKYLVDAFRDASLDWLGLHDVRILRAIPTELPEVEIRQSFLDLAFETESGELLHYEFQTTKEKDLYRFLLYDAHLTANYKKPVRTIVLYVRDVLEAPDRLNAGGIAYRVQNVYLKSRDAQAVLERLEEHIRLDVWRPEDRFDLAFVPHMRHPRMSSQEVLQRTLDLAIAIPEDNERNLMAGILLGLSGRAMSEDDIQRLKEVLKMTDPVKAIEREAADVKAREIARNLLAEGIDIETVIRATHLEKWEVEELRRQLH